MADKNAQIAAIMKVGSRRDMGELLGLSMTAIDRLAEEGKIVRLRPGVFDLVESVRTYCAHLRNIAAGRSGNEEDDLNLTEQRAKLARAQTEAQEFKNAIARGEYVKADDVELTWTDFLRDLRSQIMAVPSRVRQIIPGLTATDAALIDRELRDALTGVANGDS